MLKINSETMTISMTKGDTVDIIFSANIVPNTTQH